MGCYWETCWEQGEITLRTWLEQIGQHQKIQILVGFSEISVSHKRKWSPSAIHDDETLVNISTQSTQQRGKKEGTKREDPSWSPNNKNPKWVTKGQRNKSCFRLCIVLTQPQPQLQVRNKPYGPSI